MRSRIAWPLALLLLGGAAFTTWSLTRGQAPALRLESAAAPAANPAPAEAPAPLPLTNGSDRPPAKRDFSKLSPLQQQMLLSVERAADWLHRANRADGRFVYGYLPSLSTALEGDHYLRQAGAAVALARAARFTGDDRYMARATQAVLTLLGDTAVDPKDPTVRCTALPSAVVNRLAAAGLLVLAIHELPDPQEDLLKQSDQLCNYIRRQQRPDGSLAYTDAADAGKEVALDPDGVNSYPGEALVGLLRSQQHRPAAWKAEVARKALAFYRPWWQAHKSMAFVPWHSAACAEAYLLTKDQTFADFVNEMNDWLCGLQYERLDPRHPLWVGGFMGWADGRPTETPPDVGSAAYAEGLAEACRVARAAGDLTHFRRYAEALERCLQFLTALQYTDSSTQHFAAWYRPRLIGAFHASDQDGNLRIDYTQHALCAMIQYLTYVVR